MKTEKKQSKFELDERLALYKMRRLGLGVRAIARELGREPSNVSRELKRHGDVSGRAVDYIEKAHAAQDAAHARRVEASKRKGRLKSRQIREYVEQQLKKDITPELIAARLPLDLPGFAIGKDAIYQWIHTERKDLMSYLPVLGKKKKRRPGNRKRKLKPVATPKRSIEERPVEANERLTIGHFEVDSVIGKKGKSAVVNMVDRKSRKVFLLKVPNLCSETVAKALIARIQHDIPEEVRQTLTSDNGSEFAQWELIEKMVRMMTYFCHPGCATERGTNENRNRAAVRKYFPKGTDFDDIPDEYIEYAEKLHNERPMLIHKGYTPDEVWFRELAGILSLPLAA